MHEELQNIKLNEQQLQMLQLFKDPMPEENFRQMRRLAVQLLAKRLDQVMDEWEKDNGMTEAYCEDLSNQHFRSSGKGDK